MDHKLDAISLIDNQNTLYLTFNVSQISFLPAIPTNATSQIVNITSFLSETIRVAPQAGSIFSTDLTSRDDLILAILSLALLLLIDAILATILLRTYADSVNTFGFSLKQVVDFTRHFQFTRFFRPNKSKPNENAPGTERPRKINSALIKVAILTLTFTFGLEGLVLYLTSPQQTIVTNAMASFSLVENLMPDWNEIRDNSEKAAIQPCTTLTIEPDSGSARIDQGITRIAPCLSSWSLTESLTESLTDSAKFEKVTDPVNITIISDTHEFGAEHEIWIGDDSANYKSVVYFSLQDRRRKIMRKRSQFFTHRAAVFFKHMQYIAYLFNEYNRYTDDDSMNQERLGSLEFQTNVSNGKNIAIAQIRGERRFRTASSTRHITTVRGVIPRGPPALRFAISFFKGSTGVELQGPDLNDLDIGSASTWKALRIMWKEESRQLNWLTLTIALFMTGFAFSVLRYLLKPIGGVEIAAEFVNMKVLPEYGDFNRPIAFLGSDEKRGFSLKIDTPRASAPRRASSQSTKTEFDFASSTSGLRFNKDKSEDLK